MGRNVRCHVYADIPLVLRRSHLDAVGLLRCYGSHRRLHPLERGDRKSRAARSPQSSPSQ